MPDASLYEPLCDILGITIAELFAGQKVQNEDCRRTADADLLQMLKYHVYQSSDKCITFGEFDRALGIMTEIAAILKTFATKEEVVDYLMKGSALPEEECSAAYDYYCNLFQGILGDI